MDLWRPSAAARHFGLRALQTVGRAKGRPLSPDEHRVVACVHQFFGGAPADADTLVDIEPEALARVLVAPHVRRQVVAAMFALSPADGDVGPAEAALISRFADALSVDQSAIRNIEKLARHEQFGLKIDLLRRFGSVDSAGHLVCEPALRDAWRFVRANVGRLDDPRLAARFQQLRRLPNGTLGREYVRFLDDRRWPLPGERGALSDIIVARDMTHVLSGYETDPAGEMETACFSAGSRRRDPTTLVLFVLLNGGVAAGVGDIDVTRALFALARGASMSVDLNDGWNYWGDVEISVDDLRRRYGIAPLGDRGRTSAAARGSRFAL